MSDPTTPKSIREHKWECVAPGTYYYWACKNPGCGKTLPYPCPKSRMCEFNTECHGRVAEPSAPAEPTHIHSAIFDHGKPVPRDPKCFGCIAITERVVTQQAKAPGAPASTVCECEHPYYGCQVAGTLAKCERCGKLVAPGAPADPVESLVESAKRLARATDHLLADTRSSPSRTATVRDLVKITKRNFETALAAYEGRRQ